MDNENTNPDVVVRHTAKAKKHKIAKAIVFAPIALFKTFADIVGMTMQEFVDRGYAEPGKAYDSQGREIENWSQYWKAQEYNGEWNVRIKSTSITELPTPVPVIVDQKVVTSADSMFRSCTKLTTLDLSDYDTSSLQNMGLMFGTCYNLTDLNISNFNTSNVTDMGYMFQMCKFTEFDLSHFDTRKVMSTTCMFNACTKLTTLNLSGWDISNVTDIESMFASALALKALDITHFIFNADVFRKYLANDTIEAYNIQELLRAKSEYLTSASQEWLDHVSQCANNKAAYVEGACTNCLGSGYYGDCYSCDGTGFEECDYCNGTGFEDCGLCNGTGEAACWNCNGENSAECEYCHGVGTEKCYSCQGTGKAECWNCQVLGKKECYSCEGTGKEKCRLCEGVGELTFYQVPEDYLTTV